MNLNFLNFRIVISSIISLINFTKKMLSQYYNHFNNYITICSIRLDSNLIAN